MQENWHHQLDRFHDIQSGMITYDGIDIGSASRSLGIVLQIPLIHWLLENIAYGRADATREEILKQLQLPMWIPLSKHPGSGPDGLDE